MQARSSPAPMACAVDRRDHRHLEIEQRERQPLDAPPVVLADLHRRRSRRKPAAPCRGCCRPTRTPSRAPVRITARTERSSSIRSMAARNSCTAVLPVSGLRRLRLVHRQRDDVALLLVVAEIAHGFPLSSLHQSIGRKNAREAGSRGRSRERIAARSRHLRYTASAARAKSVTVACGCASSASPTMLFQYVSEPSAMRHSCSRRV